MKKKFNWVGITILASAVAALVALVTFSVYKIRERKWLKDIESDDDFEDDDEEFEEDEDFEEEYY